jgi:DNA-3-methyladenine glycosylase
MKTMLARSFFERDTVTVARELLGKNLVREIDGVRISGCIIETEAYNGEEDLACHAHVGRTARNSVMYGPAGHAYVYFTYGMHWLLNCVTGLENFPAAVLLRTISPLEGMEIIEANRNGRPRNEWCNGPAKICQALNIDGKLNGANFCESLSSIRIEKGIQVPQELIQSTPRVGISSVPEPWRSIPWRFIVAELSTLI